MPGQKKKAKNNRNRKSNNTPPAPARPPPPTATPPTPAPRPGGAADPKPGAPRQDDRPPPPAGQAAPGQRQEDSQTESPRNQLQIVVRSGRPQEVTKPCKSCRKPFSADSPSKLFCSVQCYIADKDRQAQSGSPTE